MRWVSRCVERILGYELSTCDAGCCHVPHGLMNISMVESDIWSYRGSNQVLLGDNRRVQATTEMVLARLYTMLASPVWTKHIGFFYTGDTDNVSTDLGSRLWVLWFLFTLSIYFVCSVHFEIFFALSFLGWYYCSVPIEKKCSIISVLE